MVFVSNTSKPSLNGTLTRFSLLKKGFPFGCTVTSLMSNLAALLPISIAASINLIGRFDQISGKKKQSGKLLSAFADYFFMQVIIGFHLGAQGFMAVFEIKVILFVI